MKKFLVLSSLIMLLISCNNKADAPGEKEDTTSTTSINYYWQSALNDSTGKLEMIKVPTTDTVSVESVVAYLNNEHPNIKLEFSRTSNDTAFLKIVDATYLTQQMGSSGPPMYLSKVVYNMTELPGITRVSLDFEEGDHASPGTFNRDSFKEE